MGFSIIGQRFGRQELHDYLDTIHYGSFHPQGVVVHNTASPNLSQRPNGFTKQHMLNLQGYYIAKGWNGGPHFFVDQNGAWVFNPLDRRGTHSPSFNSRYYGVEMLGDYEQDSFDSGQGSQVRDNAVWVVAELLSKLGLEANTNTVKFHKEDPATTHKTCPGRHVDKTDFLSRVKTVMAHKPADTRDGKIIFYRKGQGHDPAGVVEAVIKGMNTYADAKQMSQVTGIPVSSSGDVMVTEFLSGKYNIHFVPSTGDGFRIYAVEI